MSEHRWALACITRVSEERAAQLVALDMLDRLALLDDLRREERSLADQPAAIRGPVCLDCRVDYETAHHDTTKPWPCPGSRPAALGGSMVHHATKPSLSRPQRRAQQRKAVKAAARPEGVSLVSAVQSAVWQGKAERERRRQAANDTEAARVQMATALAGIDDLDGFFD